MGNTLMHELSDSFKKYLLVKYTQSKLNHSRKALFKTLPWIQSKSIFNTINTHINILLNSFSSNPEKQSLRQNKFIVDSIFKYTLERSENLLKSNKKTKDIKSYMQLNSYIVYDEIIKGLKSDKNKKTIKFNIEKQLSEIQEQMDSKVSMDELLQQVITE